MRGITDKGTDHSYAEFYDILFKDFKPKNLLEIGVFKGGGLWFWSDMFPGISLIGIDINKYDFEAPENTELIIKDIKEIDLSTIPDFDIIIDDASHKFLDQAYVLKNLIKKLTLDGWLIIEDVPGYEVARKLINYADNKERSFIVDRQFCRPGQKDEFLIVYRNIDRGGNFATKKHSNYPKKSSLKKRKEVTIVLVAYKNRSRFSETLKELLKTRGDYNLFVVDNNEYLLNKYSPAIYHNISMENEGLKKEKKELKKEIDDLNIDYDYIWNGNKGKLAGAMNRAIERINTKYFVYLCSNHIHINDPNWLNNVLDNFRNTSSDIVMGGDIRPVEEKIHLQGGCFIGKTEWFKINRYDEENFPFSYMDVYISDKIIEDKKRFIKIDGVISTMGGKPDEPFQIAHYHE